MAGNNLLAAKILRDSNTTKGGTNALAEQFPELYGAIKGLLGTAPDEVGGSVLDGSHQAQKAGAGYGFPIGLLANILPSAAPAINKTASILGKAAEPTVNAFVARTMANGGKPAQLLQDMAQGTQSPLTVWHGSPHKFDKFDASKIGTGEGAQAYGHGLYLAESPETASFYRDKLITSGTILSRGDALEARSKVLRKVADRVEKSDPERAAKLRAEADTFTRDGALYKVDLPDEHIAKMLDWDKPLSQQHPDVLSAMGYHNQPRDFEAEAKAVYGTPEYARLEKLMDTRVGSAAVPDVTGAEWYRSTDDLLRGTAADDAARSEYLRSIGIPGIRYLDGGSRGTGAGTSNFVVFPGNEGLLTILERNGQPVNELSGLLGY